MFLLKRKTNIRYYEQISPVTIYRVWNSNSIATSTYMCSKDLSSFACWFKTTMTLYIQCHKIGLNLVIFQRRGLFQEIGGPYR